MSEEFSHVQLTNKAGNTVKGKLVRRWTAGGTNLLSLDVDGTTSNIHLDADEWTLTPIFEDKVLELPLKGQQLRWGDLSHNSESIEPEARERQVTDIEHANIICSDIPNSWLGAHNVVFDIDYPVHVVESSEGHGHLYIDKPLPWNDIVALMAVLVSIGLMEPGYMFASIDRGYTSVRVPWALKNSGVHIEEPPEQINGERNKSFDEILDEF